jgi:hypothetical protein
MPLKGPEEMRREQRMIFVRVLVWAGLIGWAGYKMGWWGSRPDGVWELTRPGDVAPAQGKAATAGVPDIEAAWTVLDGVARRAAACPAHGTVSVTLGSGGLLSATLSGGGSVDCVARLAWGAPWPATGAELVLERSIE